MHGKQISNATVTKEKLTLTDPTSNNDPATKQWTESLVNNSIFMQDWKRSVRVASVGNIDLTAMPAAIDGVTLSVGDRFAAKNQTLPAQNGLYTFQGTGATAIRADDANASSEMTAGVSFYVEEGTTNAKTTWKLVTTGAITLGTTGLAFEAFSTFQAPICTLANKEMAASVTSADGDLGCSTVIAGTPANDSYVLVLVNGLGITIGNAVKTKEAYFSGDSGTTARSLANIASGDRLFWNGSVAGYQLAVTDVIDFIYEV